MSENSFGILFDEQTVVGVEQSECLNLVIKEDIILSHEKYSPLVFKKHSEQWMYTVHLMENEDSVLVGTFDSRIIRFNLDSGEIVCEYVPFESGPINIIKNVNSTVFVGGSDNFVFTFDFFEPDKKYEMFLSPFKEVMNMHFFRRLRVREPEDEEEDEQPSKKKKQGQVFEEEEDQQRRKEERDRRISQNLDVLRVNLFDLVYPTGRRRKRQFEIYDRRFVFFEQKVPSKIYTTKQIKAFREREKREKKVYNFYSRIIFTGKVKKIHWKEASNYLDVSVLVQPLKKKVRKKWLRKQRERRKILEEYYRKPIAIPRKSDFQKEYSSAITLRNAN